jgi:hypothetical protein
MRTQVQVMWYPNPDFTCKECGSHEIRWAQLVVTETYNEARIEYICNECSRVTVAKRIGPYIEHLLTSISEAVQDLTPEETKLYLQAYARLVDGLRKFGYIPDDDLNRFRRELRKLDTFDYGR